MGEGIQLDKKMNREIKWVKSNKLEKKLKIDI